MEDHERAMWQRMLDRTRNFDARTDDLGKLVADLRGLYVEADPHDPQVRTNFESFWAPIDGEHELRTERWSRPEWVSDDRLAEVLDDFSTWVRSILADEGAPS